MAQKVFRLGEPQFLFFCLYKQNDNSVFRDMPVFEP